MQSIVTDGVAWSVCLSVTVVSPAKMAEPIKVPFGCGLGWAQGTMSWGQDSWWEGAIFRGRRPIVKFRECCLCSGYPAFCQITLTTCWNLNYHTAEIAYCVKINLDVTSVKQELSSCWDGRPFGHNRHGPKVGRGCCGGWVPTGSPSNTMWPGPRPTCLPSGILIHPTVWPQL